MSSSDESLSNAFWLFGAAGGLAFFPGGGGAKSSCDADIVLADECITEKKHELSFPTCEQTRVPGASEDGGHIFRQEGKEGKNNI